jgi:uncharacterized repeat protein (TIGR02543 family)
MQNMQSIPNPPRTDTLRLYAVWKPRTYSVALDKNNTLAGNGTMAVTATYNADMPTASLVPPSHTLLIFNGYWDNSGYDPVDLGTMYYTPNLASAHVWDKTATGVTLYAHWTPVRYKVTLKKWIGTEALPAVDTARADTVWAVHDRPMPNLGITVPAKTGYYFDGYYADEDGGGKQYYDAALNSANNWDKTNDTTVIHANWMPITYIVKYDANGGVGTIANGTHTYNATDNDLATTSFTREGYTADGWATSPTGPNAYDGGDTVGNLSSIQGDIVTLYAYWNPITYTVTYNNNGATGGTAATLEDDTHTFDAANNVIQAPSMQWTKTGYHSLNGWATTDTATSVAYFASTGAVNLQSTPAPRTLYAVWVPNEYKLILDGNNGTIAGKAVDTVNVTYASKIGTLPIASRNNYTFNGWFDAGDNEYLSNATVYNVARNTTLYARWGIQPFTVTFVGNGGTLVGNAMQNKNPNETLTEPTDPTRTGYDFQGWYTDSLGDGACSTKTPYNFAAPVTLSFKLYACWTAKTYTVTLD